jgi:DHA2 family multidrug resistance protein
VPAANDLGIDKEAARYALDQITMGQSVMQATNNTFLSLGVLTLIAAATVWIAPNPPKKDPNKTVVGH